MTATPAVKAAASPGLWATRWRSAASSQVTLAFIVVLAIALRVGHVSSLRSTIWFDNLDLDPLYFDQWARRIAGGDVLGREVFFVDPLYAYVLGALYAVFGHDLLLVRLVQVALDVGTVVLIARLGQQVGSRGVGNVAALLYALYAPAIFSAGEIEKTTLSVFLFTATTVAVIRRGLPSSALGGGLLALAVLSRGNALVLAVPFVVFLARRPGCWRWQEPAAFLAGMGLVLGPVVWRNEYVGGEPILVSSAGQNLYLGNNPNNTTGAYSPPPFVTPNAQFEEQDFRAAAEAEVGHALTPGEVSQFWWGRSIDYISANPTRALALWGRKLTLLLNDYEVPDNQSIYVVARHSPVLRWPLLTFGWLVPLALVGLAVGRRAPPVRLLGALIVIYGLTLVAFFVVARFRLPAIPWVVVLGALALRWLAAEAAQRHLRTVFLTAGLVVTLSIVCLRPLSFYDQEADEASALYNLGVLEARVGDDDAAVASLKQSLSIVPENEYALAKLALLQIDQRRYEAAQDAFDRLTTLRPSWPDYWIKLGDVSVLLRQPNVARRAFLRALALDPGNSYVREQLEQLD